MAFQFNTSGRLQEIFAEHCNLSMEQYEEISRRFTELAEEYRDGTPMAEIEPQKEELSIIFDFLYNTKELTIREYNDLCNMVGEIEKTAFKELVSMDYGKLMHMIGGTVNQAIIRRAGMGE